MSDPKNECQRNFLEISPGTGVSKKGHRENSIWSKLGWFGMAGGDECISFCGDSLIQCEEVETYINVAVARRTSNEARTIQERTVPKDQVERINFIAQLLASLYLIGKGKDFFLSQIY